MEAKHRELLEQWQQKFPESGTDVERLLELLAERGCLSPAERAEIRRSGGGGRERIRRLIHTLLEDQDQNQHRFQELCWALEKTQTADIQPTNTGNTTQTHTGKTTQTREKLNKQEETTQSRVK